jgi:hypothetical protein
MFGEGHKEVLWLRLSRPGIYFAVFIWGWRGSVPGLGLAE